MKILTVSDKVDELIYSPALKRLFGDVDLVLSCGDLPHYYLEFIVTMLGGPLFYVIGNHANAVRKGYASRDEWEYPGGCENIDGHVVRYRDLLIAGLEGSMRYNQNPDFQYTEREMAFKVWGLVPSLLLNRMFYGRYLDILITHAPPYGIHDREDRCHQGFRAFRTFMDRFRPKYLIHGHIHVYGPSEATESVYRQTRVINTYGYRRLEIDEEKR
ncbi:MAG: metallophosphoesterase [Anaerolineae bacterium]|jgi:Icc-related predicted phosphoesterase